MREEGQTVVVIKKKKGHGGHHGGAWKVAYADFVTAMMAFFIVMWIIGMKSEVKEAISGYFKDPIGFTKEHASKKVIERKRPGPLIVFDTADKARLKETQKDIEKAINADPELSGLKEFIEFRVDDDGLRIELVEQEESLFFELGKADMKPEAVHLLEMIAQQLEELPNQVAVEGHTDSRGFSGDKENYTNWELSADRANAARRAMEAFLTEDKISQVRGFADRRLRDPEHPESFANRRVTVLVEPLTEEQAKEFGLPAESGDEGDLEAAEGSDEGSAEIGDEPAEEEDTGLDETSSEDDAGAGETE